MKYIFTTLYILIVHTTFSQDLTGIWRGYFIEQRKDFKGGRFVTTEEKYKYEVQLNNLRNNSIAGVTYSYNTTLFYGKAGLQGIYTKKEKVLLLKETKMIELKISSGSIACLMTCYLDYQKSTDTKKETLTGSYTSESSANGGECGSGTVYLERVTTTEFEKEDFIIKKEQDAINVRTKAKHPPTSKESTASTPTKKYKSEASNTSSLVKPGAEAFIVSNDKKNKQLQSEDREIGDTDKATSTAPTAVLEDKDTETLAKVPEVLKKRENVLSQTLIIDGKDITIEFYDNGQIDGDTISVYHDNKIIVDRKMLCYIPITVKAHVDEQNPIYEFITVAENLGEVPPNTALVVISSGSKHYEINITSDEARNAKIILEYKKTPLKN